MMSLYEKEARKNEENYKWYFGFIKVMITIVYIIMLTYAYARVAFLKAGAGQDIFNVAKLWRRNQTDHQLVQDRVHIRGLQVRRSNRGSPSLIHREDVSYRQEIRISTGTSVRFTVLVYWRQAI